MESLGHGCEQIQETKHFSGGKLVINFAVYLMVNAEKWNAKPKKWGAIPTCYRLTFLCC